MEIIVIVAAGLGNEIGKDGDLLWKLPADMNFFMKTTTDHAVVMGRKTYESIPVKYRPLKNRANIVISQNHDFSDEGAFMVETFDEAIDYAITLGYNKVFIAGGSSVYEEGISVAHRMLLTRVIKHFPDADTFLPEFDSNDWLCEPVFEQGINEKHKYDFIIFDMERK